ncbi:MAG: hypothetical protein ACK5OB_00775 [Pirellula sp.]
MQDKELDHHNLGLCTPRQVTDVKLGTSTEETRVQVDLSQANTFCCPEFDLQLPCYTPGKKANGEVWIPANQRSSSWPEPPGGQCPAHEAKSVDIRSAGPMKKFAWTLKSRIENIVTSCTYCILDRAPSPTERPTGSTARS